MRHFVLVAVAALVIAIVLVLVIGEEETAEDTTPVTQTAPASGRTETTPAPPAAEAPPAQPTNGHGVGQTAGVQRAVELYAEAAETGEVRAPPGFPTTDELSIRRVDVAGDRATARLAGGERLLLRRSEGRWRVMRVLSVR